MRVSQSSRFALILAFSFAQMIAAAQTAQGPDALKPPVAPVRAVTEEPFGITVVDRYRYMENLKDPSVEKYFREQDAYARAQLKRLPGRDALLARIAELDNATSARVSDARRLPRERYFYQKRLASEVVTRLCMRDGLSGQERVLIDPEKYPAAPGAHNAISYYTPSWDGKWVAAGVAAGGSENAVIHIVNVETGKESAETIDRGFFGQVEWRPDNRSFFYNRLRKPEPGMPETELQEKSVANLHVVGTSADKDVPALGFGLSPRVEMAPADIPFVMVFRGATQAFGVQVHGVLNELSIDEAPLESVGKPGTPWVKVCDVADDVTNFDVHGDDLYLLTHHDAPRFKVIRTSASHPDLASATTVLPEGKAVIQSFSAAADGLYVQESDGIVGRLQRIPYEGGGVQNVALPFSGTVTVTAADARVPGVLVELTSWAKARRIAEVNAQAGRVEDTKLQPLGPFDDPQDVVSEEVLVKSWDDTMVPLSIVYKRGLEKDGSNPAMLSGYGSYGISSNPSFDPKLLAWLEKGGIYAISHPRGGGEYGEDWHKGGEKLTKPNTWRDFIACAEYLIANHYTSNATLAGVGTSAGGITIGRAFTERPDLFAAALDRVGVSNALRSELEPDGPANIPEFGTMATQYGFEDLLAMDAYLHVRDGVRYPAVLLTTGWNDPRVASWEAGKMAARLQAATSSGKPVLLRVEFAGGHGIGSTKTQLEDEIADEWSFLLEQFVVKGFQAQ